MTIRSSINCPIVFCLPTACYFSREKPLVKPTAHGSLFIIFAFAIYFPLHLFANLLNQNSKISCCSLFVLRFIYPIYHFYLMLFSYLEAPYPKGIDNPFNTSGCEYLLFLCRCCLRGVRRFSYWFDNLGLITEGKYLPSLYCIIPSSLGKYRRSSSRHQKEFLAPLPGRIFNNNQVPNHKSDLLAIYFIFHLPLIFLSPTSQKFSVLFALFFVRRFLVRSVF